MQLDALKAQITSLGGGRLDAGRPEVALLAQFLGDGEQLERFQVATYDKANGVLYATSERLIFLHRSLKGQVTQQTLPLSDINHLLYLSGTLGTLQITRTSTNETEIFTKLTGPGRGEPFAEYVRARSQGKTPDEARVALPAATKTTKTGKPELSGKQGLILLLMIGVFIWGMSLLDFSALGRTGGGSGDNDAPAANVVDVGDPTRAYVECKNRVPALLKAPSTADFPFMPPYEPRLSGTTYTIRGYVDAQNSFGAMIRTEWVCSVKYNVSLKNYVVDSVVLVE